MSSSSTKQAQKASALPDPTSLPLFQYNSEPDNSNKMVDVVYSTKEKITPRISNYVVDPADWAAKKRGFLRKGDEDIDAGAPLGNNTIDAILGAAVDDAEECEICQQNPHNCTGQFCTTTFQAMIAHNENACLELRKAGPVEMGFGLFAKCDIPQGTLLSEYTGRLFPLDSLNLRDGTYAFVFGGTAYCDASQYGTLSRFVNHHCKKYNLDIVDVVYGRRKVICYTARRDIAKDEQLFVTYGFEYFKADNLCQCDAMEKPHLPVQKKSYKGLNRAAVYSSIDGVELLPLDDEDEIKGSNEIYTTASPENQTETKKPRNETKETKNETKVPKKEAEESKKQSKNPRGESKEKKEVVSNAKVVKSKQKKRLRLTYNRSLRRSPRSQ